MLLVVNAGSSSLKLMGFDRALRPRAEARLERISAGGPPTHGAALAEGLARMGLVQGDLTAAAHRVVHGGEAFTAPCRIDAKVMAGIEAMCAIAPLHNPANLEGIRALAALSPNLPQFASFDTAFHATNPLLATTYALPEAERARGLRRYGFHGLSYAGMVRSLRAKDALPRRLLAFHLGNGASACAILEGASVASSMGFSPLAGLIMGTRAGEVDGNAVLDLAARHGVAGAGRILNRESGLKGLCGLSDIREIRAAGGAAAEFALDHFAYTAARAGGSLVVAMGGLDAVAFTGGIGENDADMRARILAHLALFGEKPVMVIPAEEEREIAREALALMAPEVSAKIPRAPGPGV